MNERYTSSAEKPKYKMQVFRKSTIEDSKGNINVECWISMPLEIKEWLTASKYYLVTIQEDKNQMPGK